MNSLVENQVFRVERMTSGRACLNLNSRIDWEGFPAYAENLARFLGAEILQKTDSFDVRVWDLSIQGEPVRLVFDDFPVMVSLESTSEMGDLVLATAKSRLESGSG